MQLESILTHFGSAAENAGWSACAGRLLLPGAPSDIFNFFSKRYSLFTFHATK